MFKCYGTGATPRKKGRPKKAAVCLDDRYPALNRISITPEDEKLASEALKKEMQNTRPRKDVFLPLMKSTFTLRRHYILHDASSVHDIVQNYPILKEACAVSSTSNWVECQCSAYPSVVIIL